jgi:exonuclease SbcD
VKFFHLSDLHIGKTVNGFSMLGEQKHVFDQVIEYVKTERPAAVVIAGDVYDRPIPGVESVQVFDDFITTLAGQDTAVILISGNHDSPERMSYASRLLSEKRLFFYGTFNRELRKIVLPDEYGDVNFWLLPFIKPASVRGMFGEKEIESHEDAVAVALESVEIDDDARNVLVSHQFYTKSGVPSVRSESELNPVGGLDAVDAGLIEQFDYAALGHLHGQQSVGAKHIRYCGSPIKYSFSEWRHIKSITVVELKEKGKCSIETLPLVPLYEMREIKGPIETLMSDEVSSLANKDDYLRVILTDEEEIIDPMGKLRSVYPNVMSLDFENPRTNIESDTSIQGTETRANLSHFDLFCDFLNTVHKLVMTEEQTEIVRELLEKGEEE